MADYDVHIRVGNRWINVGRLKATLQQVRGLRAVYASVEARRDGC